MVEVTVFGASLAMASLRLCFSVNIRVQNLLREGGGARHLQGRPGTLWTRNVDSMDGRDLEQVAGNHWGRERSWRGDQ